MIPYRSEAPHECGGTICAGDPVSASPKAPPYYYCDRCDAFRFDDADGWFPTGTDRQANRDAWDDGDLRSPDAPDDSGDEPEREPWPPVDDRPEHAPQPDDAPEDCDPPDPDYDGPMVPTGGAS